MAVTPVGNPYVESSDLVANYPGASEALAERIDIVGVNPFANAAARDAAIPSPVQGQMCSLNDDNKGYRYDGSAWLLFSGAGDANFTNAATGTYTDGGIDYKYLTLTGTGSVTIDTAGFADVLVIGGGGGGGRRGGGGGAGGHLVIPNVYLPVGTHTITVGAGGVAGGTSDGPNNGNTSQVGLYAFGVGGGAGGIGLATGIGTNGGSGGGAGAGYNSLARSGGAGTADQGNNGGSNASTDWAGGGGGAGAVGANGASSQAGAGGAGLANSYTGSAVTRAGGGGGGIDDTGGSAGAGGSGGGGAGGATPVAGTANTGSGGGGGNISVNGGAGGSRSHNY